MVKVSFTISLLAALAVTVIAGCGGSSGSSDSGPASLAPPESVVFVEGDLHPSGTLKSNVDSVAGKVAGIDNLGDFIVSELESASSREGEPVDFDKEVKPWLGERAGVTFSQLEDGELSEPLIAIETTDAEATQAFVDKQAKGSKDPSRDVSYEGVDFKVGGSEGNAIGVIDEFLVIADGATDFKAAVDASNGDSLGGEDGFQSAMDAAAEGSLADVYVDVGGLIEQSGDKIDPQARRILQSSGLDPSEATAVASIIPQEDEIEVDLSSELGGEKGPTGDASELLGSLPLGAFAAVAVSDFGDQLKEAVDNLDAAGAPPDLQPHQLKSTLSQAGLNLDKIVGSLEDAAIFAAGDSPSHLRGALVATSSNSEVARAVSSLGTLLRTARVPGVTVVSGKAAGFSVHSPTLGKKPIAVVAKDKRIAIGYGVTAALEGLSTAGVRLGEEGAYAAGEKALGSTPISAFVDRAEALFLAEQLVPRSKKGFWEAVPYLDETAYAVMGASSEGDLTRAKLIVGLEK